MKASDLSPRLLSFLCLKSHVGGGNDNDKKPDVIFHPKIYLPCIRFLLILPFFCSLLCSLTSNPFASGAILACLPSLTKDPSIFFLPFIQSFFGIPLGKVDLNIFLDVWLTWCAFNKSACQAYLSASLTVPFWRSWCIATWRLARLSKSLDLTIAPLYSSLCLSWPWGALFFFFFAKRKKLLQSLNLQEAVFEFPRGSRELSTPVIRLPSLFMKFGYEL